jgi:anti-sigma factor RsiW
MRHDPATGAAAYLAGELSATELEEFEDHLLSCDDCWREVHAGRRGLLYALQGREPAPPGLRSRVLAAAQPVERPPARWKRRLVVAAAVVVGLIAGIVIGGLANRHEEDEQPVPIAAAVADYANGRLPGSRIPSTAAPDLSALGLRQAGATTGQLGGLPVTAYAYRDGGGHRLTVYIGREQFPAPYEPDQVGTSANLWIGQEGDVTILCGRKPQHTLILGDDERLVRDAARALRLT